jgi:Uncharacterized ABC-type transport system, permease component
MTNKPLRTQSPLLTENIPERMEGSMLLLIKDTLVYGIVLMLAALDSMVNEHSGIISFVLNGIMAVDGVAGEHTLTMLHAILSTFLVVLNSIRAATLSEVI